MHPLCPVRTWLWLLCLAVGALLCLVPVLRCVLVPLLVLLLVLLLPQCASPRLPLLLCLTFLGVVNGEQLHGEEPEAGGASR